MKKPTGIEQTRADTESSIPVAITEGMRVRSGGGPLGTFRASGDGLVIAWDDGDTSCTRTPAQWRARLSDPVEQVYHCLTLVSAPEPSNSQVSPQPTVQKEDLNLEISRLRKALETIESMCGLGFNPGEVALLAKSALGKVG